MFFSLVKNNSYKSQQRLHFINGLLMRTIFIKLNKIIFLP